MQVLHIITQLTSILKNPEESDRIRVEYKKYVNFDFGEFGAKKIGQFLQEVLGPENEIVKIFKACNQSIIAPAIIQLVKMCNQIKFKDFGKIKSECNNLNPHF